jgi:hypothetical protein
VDGGSYYLALETSAGAEPILRSRPEGDELLVNVRGGEASISYEMIW